MFFFLLFSGFSMGMGIEIPSNIKHVQSCPDKGKLISL